MENNILILMTKGVYLDYLQVHSQKELNKSFHWTDFENYCIEYSNLCTRQKAIILDNLKEFLEGVDERNYLIMEVINEYKGFLDTENIIKVRGELKAIINIKTEMYLPGFKMIAPFSKSFKQLSNQ
ncbi:hypothetical protein [Bacillus vallismortis]|uniref:hypothetical protein n=1 Tax=Bacillus vallismortis TaxID=72361 RepID=UPI0020910DF3|nr:hypothetical protein [Bacillus vallismortis]MCO4852438.1 hypothetical protein [Bacillus vallismortis]